MGENTPPSEPEKSWVQEEIIKSMGEAAAQAGVIGRSEALKLGAQFVEKTIRFFEELKESEHDQSIRDKLNTILEQEQEHLRRIRILLAY